MSEDELDYCDFDEDSDGYGYEEFEYEDELDEDMDEFDPVENTTQHFSYPKPTTERGTKTHRLIYDPISIEDVEKVLQDKINSLDSVLQIGVDDCALLLLKYSWNDARLQDLYTSGDPSKIRKEVGLTPTKLPDPKESLVQNADDDFMCFICCSSPDLGAPLKTFHLKHCDHVYCTNCYARYIEEQLKVNKTVIGCPDSSCKLNIGFTELKQLSDYIQSEKDKRKVIEKTLQSGTLTSEEIAKRFQQEEYDPDYQEFDDMESMVQQKEEEEKMFYFDETINAREKKEKIEKRQSTLSFWYWYTVASHYCNIQNRVFKFCPFPDCDSIIKMKGFDSDEVAGIKEMVNKLLVPSVQCHEHHRFCFNCLEEDHRPMPCDLCKEWLEKCKGESETAKWITVNTKICPMCETSIEKNGGCNHMTCYKCRYEFCWVCLGDWKRHKDNYNCDVYRPDEEAEVRKEQTKKALQKYMFYFERFDNQMTSIKKDKALVEQLESRIKKVQMETGVSWIESLFYREAIEALLGTRRTLMWSYAVLFAAPQGIAKRVMEGVQNALFLEVEKLSKLFEETATDSVIAKKNEFQEYRMSVLRAELTMLDVFTDQLVNKKITLDRIKGT